MKYPKFIVLRNLQGNIEIRFGHVELHRDLINESDKKHANKCIGGGLIEIVDSKKEIWFYGQSEDFGRVDEKILNNIKLTQDNYDELDMVDKICFQANVDHFNKVTKNFTKYKLIVKNF